MSDYTFATAPQGGGRGGGGSSDAKPLLYTLMGPCQLFRISPSRHWGFLVDGGDEEALEGEQPAKRQKIENTGNPVELKEEEEEEEDLPPSRFQCF